MSRLPPRIGLLFLGEFGADELAGRMAVANTIALELGWRLFEPFLRSATGTEKVSAADLRRAINSGTARLMEPNQRSCRSAAGGADC
jgi:hypothetical protein